MNVLSLFDGMSCGQIALDQLGFKVDNYFASEIDESAIQITKKNYPGTIHIGDVTEVDGSDLPQIDLLIGGSPCQGFTLAGKQLNFDDPRSKLFFEYVRLLEETNPKYFLLENVRMKKEYQDVISEHLGVEPIYINSSLVSAQNRQRLYWTNIPNIEQPKDKGITTKDILMEELENPLSEKLRWKHHTNLVTEKSACLTAGMYKGIRDGHLKDYTDTLHPIECERLQTVPDNYTEGVPSKQRYKMLGNGWTVDVIKHIFSNIK